MVKLMLHCAVTLNINLLVVQLKDLLSDLEGHMNANR